MITLLIVSGLLNCLALSMIVGKILSWSDESPRRDVTHGSTIIVLRRPEVPELPWSQVCGVDTRNLIDMVRAHGESGVLRLPLSDELILELRPYTDEQRTGDL